MKKKNKRKATQREIERRRKQSYSEWARCNPTQAAYNKIVKTAQLRGMLRERAGGWVAR